MAPICDPTSFNPSVGILWGLACRSSQHGKPTYQFQSLGRDSVGFSQPGRALAHRLHPKFQSLGRDSVGFS